MNSRMQIRRVKADATIELSRLATGLDDAWATQEAWVASLDPIVGDTSDSLPGPVAAVLDAEETMRDALRSSGRLATI
ncbi:MAG: hypothetical protein JWN86_1426 [Planctomycetota bacterium]|nr:hypothetical protein [Planctomycetota bacterium]